MTNSCKNCFPYWNDECEEFSLKENEGFCNLHKIVTNRDDSCVTKNHQTESSISITSVIKTNNGIIIEIFSDEEFQKLELSNNDALNIYEMLKKDFD